MADPAALRAGATGQGRGALLAVLAGLAIMVTLLGYTGRDDSHITYFVADMVARGHGIVNYNGEPVEQSSTLLFTLILAGLVKLTGLPAAALGPFVSFGFLLLLFGAMAAVLRRVGRPPALLVAGLAPPLVYWALSGMEISLYTFLLFLLVVAYPAPDTRLSVPRLGWLALLGAGLSLTRPEAPFVLVLWLGITVLAEWPRPRVAPGAVIIAGIAAALAFRLAIGLELFPNPVYAKQTHESLAWRAMTSGYFLLVMLMSVPLTTLLGLYAFVRVSAVMLRDRGKTMLLEWRGYTLGVSIFAFALASGGDWMEAGRFLAPAFLLLFLLGLGLLGPDRRRKAVAILCASFAFDTVHLASQDYGGVPLPTPTEDTAANFHPAAVEHWNVPHSRDLSFIDKALVVLDADPREHVVLASIQGGAVLYYLTLARPGKIHFVDFHGITSNDLRDCRAGDGWPYEPYTMLEDMQTCSGLHFDYIFDVELSPGWSRLEATLDIGCTEVLREEIALRSAPWRAPSRWRQFMVRCDRDVAPSQTE